MTTSFRCALVLTTVLCLTQAAAAADQYGAPPSAGGLYTAPPPYPPPLVLPPCRDSFWGSVLLQCVPRAVVHVPYDDVYLQNQIRGLRPGRKPYIQVFKW